MLPTIKEKQLKSKVYAHKKKPWPGGAVNVHTMSDQRVGFYPIGGGIGMSLPTDEFFDIFEEFDSKKHISQYHKGLFSPDDSVSALSKS